MQQSEMINELADALAQFQSGAKSAKADKVNPFFRSKYADLQSIWEAIREPLTHCGLAVVQTMDFDGQDPVIVTTLTHKSGQWIRGRLKIKAVDDSPQKIGSAITYGRRYSLSAIVGIVSEEDDDANVAQGLTKTTQAQSYKPKTSQPAGEKPKGLISEKQRKRFYALTKAGNKSEEEVKEFLKTTIGVESSKDIPWERYEEACKWTGVA